MKKRITNMAITENGWTPPLLSAIYARDYDRAKTLLMAKANVNVKDYWGTSAIVSTAYSNCVDLAKLLLDAKASKEQGGIALIIACQFPERIDLIKVLLQGGVNTSVKFVGSGCSPFIYIISENKKELLKLFLTECNIV